MIDVFDTKAVIKRIYDKGFTFSQIGNLAGIDQQTIRNVWHGKTKPNITTAKRMAALDVLVSDFITKTEAIQKL